jgi:hypothetical protein
MKDILDAYFEARNTLYAGFGYDENFPELIDRYTHVEWYNNGEGVNWIEDDDEYSVEFANLIGEADGFVLFNIQDNGREYHMILHRDNEVTDEDELEEKFDY